jgi:cell division protein FtsA
MAKQSTITAIDLGTDKCVTLIAQQNPETKDLQVIGVSAVKSQGMKKSVIVDLEKVIATLTKSLDAAERMAGTQISNAWVSISGPHIKSQNSKGVVAVANPNQEIVPSDVDRVIEAARAISLPNDRQIIHVLPRDFKVDSQSGIKDPVGMTGIRLESEAHIITGMNTAMKNLQKCIHDLGVELNGFVFSGLSSSYAGASETEKELGVAIVDIGSGSTNICVYSEGVLEASMSLPIGARHITQDIALGCRISLESAEKLKLALSSKEYQNLKPNPGESKEEFNKRKRKSDKIELDKIGIQEEGDKDLSRKSVVEGIMVPRMKEIFTLIGQELEKQELFDAIPAGVIITGGGAETVEIVKVAKNTLRLPARVGKPHQLDGLTSDISGPGFATAIGLLEYGKNRTALSSGGSGFSLSDLFGKSKAGGDMFGKVGQIFKSLLP